jgi:hypothetical protein
MLVIFMEKKMKLEIMLKRKAQLEAKIEQVKFSEERKLEIFKLPSFQNLLPLNIDILDAEFLKIAKQIQGD